MNELPSPEPPVCGICGCTEITPRFDVGSDIDPDGEERQHLFICDKCGAQQLWIHRWDFNSPPLDGPKIHHGKWCKKEDCPPLWY